MTALPEVGERMSITGLYYEARAHGWDPTPWERRDPEGFGTLADGWLDSAVLTLNPPQAPGDFQAVLDGSARWALRRAEALSTILQLPDDSVDALITDPPYSSGGQFRGDRDGGGNRKYLGAESSVAFDTFEGDNRDQRSYLLWCTLWLDAARRKTKDGGICIVFADWRQVPVTTDAIQAGGWVWRGILPWLKPAHRPQQGRFSAGAEFIVWGSKGPMAAGGECHPGWIETNSPRDREHPTEKPEALMRELVKIVPENGVVLDPFCGSGTTLAAALAEGRRGFGTEASPGYAEVTRRHCTAIMELRDRRQPEAQQGLFQGGTQ